MQQDKIHLPSLLKCLIECSEKAACIAQTMRSENDLFQLLIQEKKSGEKNMRFVQDFKTLADVLVQETVRWDVSRKFPSLASTILGEENSTFQNALGESVTLSITDSVEETTNLLCTVLDDRRDAAKALARSVHSKVEIVLDLDRKSMSSYLPADEIGIWIDPIDSTGEYVHGSDKKECSSSDSLTTNGLKCVAVLIGAYILKSGLPVIGVVNQPFYTSGSDNKWKSQYYWGLCHGNAIATSRSLPSTITEQTNRILVSGAEDMKLLKVLEAHYSLQNVAGSGYKSLLVALGQADLYVLSLGTCFLWDTCGPQAVLMALGGGIVNFKSATSLKEPKTEDLHLLQLKYFEIPELHNCNVDGIIAYRNPEAIIGLLNYLAQPEL